jgi:alpha-L-fucosidase
MKVSTNRLDIMDTETVDGVQEKDPMTLNFDEFKLTRQASRHYVKQYEVNRPDLISFDEYGTTYLWWFIMQVNGIIDPWTIAEDTVLTIPNLLDYYDWFRSQKES